MSRKREKSASIPLFARRRRRRRRKRRLEKGG
jgi:hypothetical protein